MSKIGYARCSSIDQNPERQKLLLKEAGCEKIFLDMLSGKDRNRPELEKMLDYVRDGDVLYVESISRLARSTKDLLTITEELTEKGVQFISQKENIDTSSPQGKFMLTVFAAMAELEREQIKQRQSEGIAIAKAAGKYKGRQPIKYDEDELENLYMCWKNGDITKNYICRKLGVSKSTLYRILKRKQKVSKDVY